MCKVLVGVGLGPCIRDLIDGLVDITKVREIQSNTQAKNETEWKQIIDCLKQSDWRKNPKKAEETFNNLLKCGKISQPRLLGKKVMITKPNKHWFEN